MTSEQNDQHGELRGWKEIAAHLGVSAKTAQKWERERRLPIHRFDNSDRSPVWVTVREVNVWKSSIAPTAVSGSILAAANLEGDPGVSQVRLTPRFKMVMLGLLVAGTMAIALTTGLMLKKEEIADFKIEGSTLSAVDAKGRQLWSHVFPWDLRDSSYSGEERRRHHYLGDAVADRSQFIFSAISYHEVSDGTPTIGFDSRGKVLWQFVPGRSVVDQSGDKMVPPYLTSSIMVIRGRTPAETRIVVSSNHYLGHANQIAFLNSEGHVVGEYWHPGHLLRMQQVDLDGDGRKELLLAGVNNGNHQATLVVLDPLKVSEAVTQYDMTDPRFALQGLARATERAVVLFPRSCISSGQPYTRVGGLQVSPNRIVVPVSESIDDAGQGFIYEFGYDLQVLNVVPNNGVSVAEKHRDLERTGRLDHPFDAAKELARLQTGVIVRRGETPGERRTE